MTGFLAAGTCDHSSTNNKKGGYLSKQTGGSSCSLALIPLLLCDSSDLQVTESLAHAGATNNFAEGMFILMCILQYFSQSSTIQGTPNELNPHTYLVWCIIQKTVTGWICCGDCIPSKYVHLWPCCCHQLDEVRSGTLTDLFGQYRSVSIGQMQTWTQKGKTPYPLRFSLQSPTTTCTQSGNRNTIWFCFPGEIYLIFRYNM